MNALATRPRLGFVGIGWIGRQRLDTLARSGLVEIAGASDPAFDELDVCPRFESIDELLDEELEGLVIATPSALHTDQAVAALEHGVAVFCQKPVGVTAAETRRAVEAARQANRLLGVDLSYRELDAVSRLREQEIGEIFAVELAFHNAYGPGKPWSHDPALAGGGCVIDLGIHLLDLALWWLDYPRVTEVTAQLRGQPVERFAAAQLELETGASIRLACSWQLHIGCDCVFETTFYGENGSVSIRNVHGSFYDFVGELRRGTSTRVLSAPPDDWSGRAALRWADRLAAGAGFDPEIERLVDVASVIDSIYESA